MIEGGRSGLVTSDQASPRSKVATLVFVTSNM